MVINEEYRVSCISGETLHERVPIAGRPHFEAAFRRRLLAMTILARPS